MTSRATIATKLRNELSANVDALYSDAKSHEAFSADNRAIWQRAERLRIAPAVSALLRGDGEQFAELTA